MKALIPTTRTRPAWVTPLLCAFLCLCLSTGALASDPDDDLGLPSITDGDDDDGTQDSTGDAPDIQISADVLETPAADDQVGFVLLDRTGDTGTTYETGASTDEAEVVPKEDDFAPANSVTQLDDGVKMQGRMLLQLPYKGEGDLQAKMRSPPDAVDVRALLTVDNLDSLDELLADPSSIPYGVTTVLPVGKVATVNLNAFQKLVDLYGYVLSSGHVSVVILSKDSSGGLHVAAARLPASGGQMEIVTR